MAFVVKDRVQETTTTTGTGTLTLAGAVAGFQTFSAAIGNGNTTYYAIFTNGGAEWEVGYGTVAAGTLARTTVLASSNAGALVTLSAGTKNVICTSPASESVLQDNTNTSYSPQFGASNGMYVNSNTVSASYTIPTNYNAMSAGKVTVNSGVTVTIPSGSRWVIV